MSLISKPPVSEQTCTGSIRGPAASNIPQLSGSVPRRLKMPIAHCLSYRGYPSAKHQLHRHRAVFQPGQRFFMLSNVWVLKALDQLSHSKTCNSQLMAKSEPTAWLCMDLRTSIRVGKSIEGRRTRAWALLLRLSRQRIHLKQPELGLVSTSFLLTSLSAAPDGIGAMSRNHVQCQYLWQRVWSDSHGSLALSMLHS